ncbi:MAG: hypothetical protein ACD_62C00145G0001 [uncultured bacterium]|nr:MAG: hypothetical protein ACD_62C00145G0001 [uncultured bacterium]
MLHAFSGDRKDFYTPNQKRRSPKAQSYDGVLGQRMARFFKTRFNYLSFEGPPLQDPAIIWNEIVFRCDELQLGRDELCPLLGVPLSYSAFKELILTRGPLPDNIRIAMTELLHIRLWPHFEKIPFESLEGLATRINQTLAEWRMSHLELSILVGRGIMTDDISRVVGGHVQRTTLPALVLAEYFGFEIREQVSHEIPEVGLVSTLYELDQELMAQIRACLEASGKTLAMVAQETGLYCVDGLQVMIDGEREITAYQQFTLLRRSLEPLCDYLGIRLRRFEDMTPTDVWATEEDRERALKETAVVQACLDVMNQANRRFLFSQNEVMARYNQRFGPPLMTAKVLNRLMSGDFTFKKAGLYWHNLLSLYKINVRQGVLFAASQSSEINYDALWRVVQARTGTDLLSTHPLSTRYDAYRYREKTLPLADPRFLQRCVMAGAHGHVSVQILLEQGNQEARAIALNLPESFVLFFPSTKEGWAEVVERRQTQLRQQLANYLKTKQAEWRDKLKEDRLQKGRPKQTKVKVGFYFQYRDLTNTVFEHLFDDVHSAVEASDESFIQPTGGDLSVLAGAVPDHLCYLFSVGDVFSVAWALFAQSKFSQGQNNRIEIVSKFLRMYGRWLRVVYQAGQIDVWTHQNGEPVRTLFRQQPLMLRGRDLERVFEEIQQQVERFKRQAQAKNTASSEKT